VRLGRRAELEGRVAVGTGAAPRGELRAELRVDF
jgi:hypothetical protein